MKGPLNCSTCATNQHKWPWKRGLKNQSGAVVSVTPLNTSGLTNEGFGCTFSLRLFCHECFKTHTRLNLIQKFHISNKSQLFYQTQQTIGVFLSNRGELGEYENAEPDETAKIKFYPFLQLFSVNVTK